MDNFKQKWMIFRPIVKIVNDYNDYIYISEGKKKLPDIEKGEKDSF